MKKKEKRMIAILVVVSIIIIAVIYFATRGGNGEENLPEGENKVVEEFVQVLEDGTKLNTSTKLKETKKIEGLEISNIQLTNANGLSVVLADVINKTDKATDLMAVRITLVDKNGNKLGDVNGLISPLQPGASTQLNMGTQTDYANAYDFTVVKK